MSDAILFSNTDRDVVLVDLLRLLEESQVANKILTASARPQAPYRSTEPQGATRDRMLQQVSLDVLEYHGEIHRCCSRALHAIKRQWSNPRWCFPRDVHYDPARSPKSLGTRTVPGVETGGDRVGIDQCDIVRRTQSMSPIVLSLTQNYFSGASDVINTTVHNVQPHPTTVHLNDQLFYIPPSSTFILATIEAGMPAFANAVQILVADSVSPMTSLKFDVVVLDPPWSNRSVRRSRQYSTSEAQDSDLFGQVLPVLKDYVAAEGLVCIWITNKASIRQQVIKCLRNIDFELSEEWIWLKITTTGKPVYPLDGVWRKPYEVLLHFRRHKQLSGIKRRVLTAVPDAHSRKPCLKRLLETLLPQPPTVLELFARHLVTGWWSWGDEVLKFQHKRYWSDPKEVE